MIVLHLYSTFTIHIMSYNVTELIVHVDCTYTMLLQYLYCPYMLLLNNTFFILLLYLLCKCGEFVLGLRA